jgi:hypothetical protein
MLIDYFNDCTRARNLAITAQIKIMRESSLVFTGLRVVIYLWLPSENYKLVSCKKKEFKNYEDLLVSFRLYFVAVGDNLCISTMYNLLV